MIEANSTDSEEDAPIEIINSVAKHNAVKSLKVTREEKFVLSNEFLEKLVLKEQNNSKKVESQSEDSYENNETKKGKAILIPRISHVRIMKRGASKIVVMKSNSNPSDSKTISSRKKMEQFLHKRLRSNQGTRTNPLNNSKKKRKF